MYELSNYNEVLVKRTLEEYLPQSNIPCKCDRCRADIMAFALNRLPPRYFVSLKGKVFTNFEAQKVPDKARILAEVVAGAQIVATSPSHTIDKSE